MKANKRRWVRSILFVFFGGWSSVYAQAIPQGKVESIVFNESKIFPGTEREVFVYLPANFDKSKPACLYVQQDGLGKQKTFPGQLDTLIANKEIPPLVGVFITPGKLTSAIPETLPRPNRSFEYDGLSDRYVRFLLEEILPLVEKKYGLKLSTNGNDCAIGGASSGGIAAFNAAWERPDAFRRVYCNSGSFTAFRGGHEFPTLVRKTEPKPIRAYLTTATNDMENSAGDWNLIDLQMEKALKFAGYDYVFHQLEGSHAAGYEEHFAGAMRFLWKDWPQAIKTEPKAPRLLDIILPGENWQLTASGVGEVLAPAVNSRGEVFFAASTGNKIQKIGLDGRISDFVADAGKQLGLSVGPKDELYAISAATGKITRYDPSGNGTSYAEDIAGHHVLARPDGGLYVTSAAVKDEPSKIWLIEKGKKPVVVDTGLKQATGLAMTPDRWLLAVADGKSHWVHSYEITDDGKLRNHEPYFWLHRQDWDDDSGAESICYDQEGHLYVATRQGIQVCARDGATQVILPLPGGRVTGICLGGAGLDTLFAFSGDKIYSRKIKNHTLGAFTPWRKMTRGKL